MSFEIDCEIKLRKDGEIDNRRLSGRMLLEEDRRNGIARARGGRGRDSPFDEAERLLEISAMAIGAPVVSFSANGQG